MIARPTEAEAVLARAERFSAFVAMGEPDACWPWTGGKADGAAYGGFYVSKTRRIRAHRAAWIIANSAAIPDGVLVCHRCDNPPCCNPAHLFLGTIQDNNADRVAKGRTVAVSRRSPASKYRRGADHSCAKLTPEQVAAIRQDPRSHTETAKDYGVSLSTISRIRRGDRWSAKNAATA